MAAIRVPGRLPSPPSTQIAKTRPIYSRPTEGSTGWMMMSNAPAIAAVAIEMPKAMRLMRIGSAAISCSASWILRHRHDRAAGEGSRQEHLHHARTSPATAGTAPACAVGFEHAEPQAWSNIVGLDVAIVDAEHQNQHHLGDEQQAEEKGEPAQGVLAALLERHVVDLIKIAPSAKNAGSMMMLTKIGSMPKFDVDDIGDIGAENDEGRVRDVDDVEHAERDRNAGGDGGIEAAEQQPGDDSIDQ